MSEQDDWVMRFIAPLCDTILVLREVGDPGEILTEGENGVLTWVKEASDGNT